MRKTSYVVAFVADLFTLILVSAILISTDPLAEPPSPCTEHPLHSTP